MSSVSSIASLTMYERLHSALEADEWTAEVYGLGHIGLPLFEALATRQTPVFGIDINERLIASLANGHERHGDADRVSQLIAHGHGRVGTGDSVSTADVVFVCVPTPLDQNRKPDHSYVRAALETVAERARPGQLVALESTVSVGATRALVNDVFPRHDLEPGIDIFVVHAPSRYNPGDERFPLAVIPRVVGGIDARSTELGRLAYEAITPDVRPVGSLEVAELSKLFENSFRSVNIALVNELAMLSNDLGVDVWEVIEAAASKPFGFLPHDPGPGVGGHCIPIDPEYLVDAAHAAGSPHTTIIERAGQLNRGMPAYVVERLKAAPTARNGSLKGCHVLVIGVTYKPDVEDLREAPALDLIAALRAAGATVSYHDPLVEALGEAALESVPLDRRNLEAADMAVLVTDHTDLDFRLIAEASHHVLDTRNALRRRGIHDEKIEAL